MVGQTPKVQLVQSVGMLMMMRRRPGAGLGVLGAATGDDVVLSGASGRDERSDLHLGRRWGAGPPTTAAAGTTSSSKCL